MKSWKTTAAGVLGLLGLVCTQLVAMWDNDPLTVANWGVVIAAVPVCIGLLFAKDSKVTGGTIQQ